MKTTIAGLIPIAPFSAYIGGLFFAAAGFMSTSLQAAVDDWPATASLNSQDQVESLYATQLQQESALTCRPSVQISLDQNGQAVVTPSMLVIAPDYPIGMYVVDIMGPLTNVVTCAQIGQEVMAMVEELPTGNFCMSTLVVEDKLKPVIDCSNDTIPCNTDIQSIDFLDMVEITDNCDDDPSVFYQYTVTDLNCDPNGFAGHIDVTYSATDDYGNSST
jgi:hypothetical protein